MLAVLDELSGHGGSSGAGNLWIRSKAGPLVGRETYNDRLSTVIQQTGDPVRLQGRDNNDGCDTRNEFLFHFTSSPMSQSSTASIDSVLKTSSLVFEIDGHRFVPGELCQVHHLARRRESHRVARGQTSSLHDILEEVGANNGANFGLSVRHLANVRCDEGELSTVATCS